MRVWVQMFVYIPWQVPSYGKILTVTSGYEHLLMPQGPDLFDSSIYGSCPFLRVSL